MSTTLHPFTKTLLEEYVKDPEKKLPLWLFHLGETYKLKQDRETSKKIYDGMMGGKGVLWAKHVLAVDRIKEI